MNHSEPDTKNNNVKTPEPTSKSPSNFVIPKYADKFKDIIAKSSLNRKFVPL